MPSHDDDVSRRCEVMVIGAGSGLTGAPVAGDVRSGCLWCDSQYRFLNCRATG